MTDLVTPTGDRGTGVFGTAFGFTVFLIFLLFTVQLLFGLYARTTVTAVASDLAQLAANEGTEAASPARQAFYRDEGQRRLGDYGDDVVIVVRLLDGDRDGVDDTVAVDVVAPLPSLLPSRWIGAGPETIERTMRARLEVVQDAP